MTWDLVRVVVNILRRPLVRVVVNILRRPCQGCSKYFEADLVRVVVNLRKSKTRGVKVQPWILPWTSTW